jgi:hypothetical protein
VIYSTIEVSEQNTTSDVIYSTIEVIGLIHLMNDCDTGETGKITAHLRASLFVLPKLNWPV